jgi:hypothetical protein
LELIRGKSGRLIGNYVRGATTLKGLGLAYYKDLQEDKEPLFDSINTISIMIKVFTNVIATLKVKEDRIRQGLDPFLLATDMADYLVRKGMPFRQAHKVVGRLVGYCAESGVALTDVSIGKLREFSEMFGDDVTELYSWDRAVNSRTVKGGTSLDSVEEQIKTAERILSDVWPAPTDPPTHADGGDAEARGDGRADATERFFYKNIDFLTHVYYIITKEDLTMITAEMPKPTIKYPPNIEVEEIDAEDDEEYSEEFLDEIEREAEEAFRQIDRGELKPIDLKAFALKHGVNLKNG